MILVILQCSDHGAQILAISIHCESNDIPSASFGKRAHVYPGKAPLRDIFEAEIAGDQTEKRPAEVDWNTQRVVDGNELENGSTIRRDDKILVTGKLWAIPVAVTVSAAHDVRDGLRHVVRDHLGDGVQYFELDYQPSRK
jgi:hypothetical protein